MLDIREQLYARWLHQARVNLADVSSREYELHMIRLGYSHMVLNLRKFWAKRVQYLESRLHN